MLLFVGNQGLVLSMTFPHFFCTAPVPINKAELGKKTTTIGQLSNCLQKNMIKNYMKNYRMAPTELVLFHS